MTLDEVAALCRNEFPHLVRAVLLADPRRGRIRLSLTDATFIDIHQNPDGRYSYHWQREDGSFRFNNAPHFDQIGRRRTISILMTKASCLARFEECPRRM